MKIKTIPLIAMGMILIAAVAVSYLISRPGLFVGQRKMPIFMGEELIVKKAVEGVGGVRMASKAEVNKVIKAASVPAPQPKVATPLPIFPPRISYSVLPNYPASALEQGLGGIAILSIYVGLTGDPEKIEVKSSSGIAELDESAVTAVSQWKFIAASQGGRTLASWFELPIRFEVR